MESIINPIKSAEGSTETLKARDRMEWVRKMNSIHSREREVVLNDLTYS